MNRGGAVTTYTYDALGQRLATWSSSAGRVRFVWRGGHVAYETDGGGALQRSYTWGADTDDLVAVQDHAGGQRYYPVQDGLRSVRALVRADGTWVAGRRYKVYGGQLVVTGSDPFPLRFRWAGAQFDEETGLYYLRNRYYDPGLGRFTQEDPAGYWGGSNLFAYAGNPAETRDPDGLAPDPGVAQYRWERSGYPPGDEWIRGCFGTLAGCYESDFWDSGHGTMFDYFDLLRTLHDIHRVSYGRYSAAHDERVAAGAFSTVSGTPEKLSPAGFEEVKDAIIGLLELRASALSVFDNAYAVVGLTGMLSSGRFGAVESSLSIGGGAAASFWNGGSPIILIGPGFSGASVGKRSFLLAHEFGHVHYHAQYGFQGGQVAADHFAVRATGLRQFCYPYSRCASYRP